MSGSEHTRNLLCYLDAVERGDERAMLIRCLPAMVEAAEKFRVAMERLRTASAATSESVTRLRQAVERMAERDGS